MWYGNTSEVKEFFSNFGTVTLVETSDSSIISGKSDTSLYLNLWGVHVLSPVLSQLVPRWSWKWISPQACPEASLSSASSMRHPSSLFGRRAAEGRAVRWSGAAAGKVDVMRLVPTCSHPVGSQLNMWWSFEVWGLLNIRAPPISPNLLVKNHVPNIFT